MQEDRTMTTADRVEEIRALYTSDGLTFAFGWRDAIRDLLTALDTERERAKAAEKENAFLKGDDMNLYARQAASLRQLLQEKATAERERDAAREESARLRKAVQVAVDYIHELPIPTYGATAALIRIDDAAGVHVKPAKGDAALAPGNAPPNREEIQGEVGMEVLPEEAPTAPAGPSEEAMEAAGIVERWIGKEFDSDESNELLVAFARALDALAGRVKP